MKNKLSPILLSFTILLAVSLLVSCSSPEEKKEESKPVAKAPTHLATFELKKGNLASSLQIPAELTAYKQVDLYAKVNSYVKNLTVDVGSSVKTGQLLATLEAPELLAQVSSAQSKLKSQEAVYISSNATYQRILETSKTPGTVSKNDVEIALAKKNSDFAQFEAAKADFKASSTITEYLSIHAPFDGVISARNVNLGAYTGPSGKGSDLPIFTLQELTHLRLVISVPEAYKSFIHLGDEVTFTVKAFANQTFTAKIARRAGVMDKTLRSEHIELDVPNTDLKLSPGMVAEATINLQGGTNAFIAPKSAVMNSPESVFMIQVVNGKAVKLNVVKGRETDSLTEVFGNDLTEGSTYIKTASEEIRNGSAIK
jgi:membrane fusion protein (multidrug efflux system)